MKMAKLSIESAVDALSLRLWRLKAYEEQLDAESGEDLSPDALREVLDELIYTRGKIAALESVVFYLREGGADNGKTVQEPQG